MHFVGGPYYGTTDVRRGSDIVPLDRASVSYYRLSTSLSAAVWPQFATQLFGGGVSTSVWWGRGGSAVEAVDRALVNVYSLLIVTGAHTV